MDKEHPLEKRNKIKELKVDSKGLTNELEIQDWPQLEKIEFPNNEITSLTLHNCPQLKEVIFYNNHLTRLDITKCPEINCLDVSSNQLTDLNFLNNLDPTKLTNLGVKSNNFSPQKPQNLTIFSRFVELKNLRVSNNPFTGSLGYLQPLTKLELLNVVNTELISGLEYLPAGLKEIRCTGQLAEQLKGCEKWLEGFAAETLNRIPSSKGSLDTNRYDYQSWRKKYDHGLSNAQKWLNKEYPEYGKCLGEFDKVNKGKKREEITELDISHNTLNRIKDIKLEGRLSLTGFVNLKKFDCYGNKITALDLSSCIQLEEVNCSKQFVLGNLNLSELNKLTKLDCSGNYSLTELNLSDCSELTYLKCCDDKISKITIADPKKLVYLDISTNDLPAQDLTFFKEFTNLEELDISRNRWCGTLEPLKNCVKLVRLDISGTDLYEGIEYLPISLEKFELKRISNENDLVNGLWRALFPYNYSIKKWRDSGDKLVVSGQPEKPPSHINIYGETHFGSLVTKISSHDEKRTLTSVALSTTQFEHNSQKHDKINIMAGIRNILLIGRTGAGKSTLANVLSKTDNFKESSGISSETKNIQTELFEEGEIRYQVIDTVGIGDDKLSLQEALIKITGISLFCGDGLNQIFFVSSGRLDQEKEAYDLLKSLFSEDISKYVTIIRTRSPNNEETYKNDRQKIGELIGEIKSERIIFVDNPTLPFININDDEEEKEEKENEIKINKRKREKSRKKLLEYLGKNCNEVYKPNNLGNLKDKIKEISSMSEDEVNKKLTQVKNDWSGAIFNNNAGSKVVPGGTFNETHYHAKEASTTNIGRNTDYSRSTLNFSGEGSQNIVGNENQSTQNNNDYISETVTPLKQSTWKKT
ncbi:MAG: hypothetical protein MRERV_10c048 [Mycoplasmataceae bacterium RV_VA103A]|nr:MAG: hypothetical protein MRERV_10c048 [Mycoplasmataceae bacterium RV_VA103A]